MFPKFNIGQVIKRKGAGAGATKFVVTEIDSNSGIYKLSMKESVLPHQVSYSFSELENLFEPYSDDLTEKTEKCWLHDWSLYVGITQKYEYCTKCDLKREVKEL